MTTATTGSTARRDFRKFPLYFLAPLSLPVLQPLLRRLAARIAERRPEIFDRLGPHGGKRFLIDPVNLPFMFLLTPRRADTVLRACRRGRDTIVHDARIAGTFLTLFDMIDGRLDGDALFFNRDLIVEGDTEAVVVLRNALDDIDGSVADDIAQIFGLPGRILLSSVRGIRKRHHAAA